ncbi:hypothetical protein BATDEDRAFT_92902 [Batrachochytrium dendrobatidis JAM81]|uniref:Uncharacterized protein n=1 Tax=Batrachochytrium dendrobatidis (strain JAM81 / FGSC 10211) TaxID=684364 RepID=F4PEU6_BATDJ|nr:uncharacterized protein BATDEDRAFT_92902 [Batrachochytrium dendrobatidis JAM81]EGF76240.1 hypothetical protein BATDEDRAFT_92902 [Batrachochytrium dendrobatidis JAM81]|eukprot:XP_006683130.1 hypothetical protein BATDEDRAFT_92902 [Batrachochytrium dendrobatidis JAM81]
MLIILECVILALQAVAAVRLALESPIGTTSPSNNRLSKRSPVELGGDIKKCYTIKSNVDGVNVNHHFWVAERMIQHYAQAWRLLSVYWKKLSVQRRKLFVQKRKLYVQRIQIQMVYSMMVADLDFAADHHDSDQNYYRILMIVLDHIILQGIP